MDKAKTIHLIEEADDIVSALYRKGANKDYKCKSLREKLKAIAAEISEPPKTNCDRIRQMTDEELAEFLEKNCSCQNCCIYHPASCKHIRAQCTEGYNKWLRKEVSEDAGTDW